MFQNVVVFLKTTRACRGRAKWKEVGLEENFPRKNENPTTTATTTTTTTIKRPEKSGKKNSDGGRVPPAVPSSNKKKEGGGSFLLMGQQKKINKKEKKIEEIKKKGNAAARCWSAADCLCCFLFFFTEKEKKMRKNLQKKWNEIRDGILEENEDKGVREEGGVGSSITKRLHCAFFIFLLDFNGFRGGPRWRSTDCAAVLLVPKVFFFFFT